MILVLKVGEKEGMAGLFKNSLMKKSGFKVDKALSGEIFKVVENLFLKNKEKIQGLKGIVLLTDPNTFSSQRIAITIANTFYLVYKTPLCLISKQMPLEKAFKKGKKNLALKILTPFYIKKPNIVLSR